MTHGRRPVSSEISQPVITAGVSLWVPAVHQIVWLRFTLHCASMGHCERSTSDSVLQGVKHNCSNARDWGEGAEF